MFPAVSDESLHFGSLEDDPTGVADCGQCNGTTVVAGQPCSSCQNRQELRNGWWKSSGGPERLRDQLRHL